MIKLGVNIDHIATVRQARKEGTPDPVEMAVLALKAGADSITAHLREDRRHIQDGDVARLRKMLSAPLNLEMAAAEEIVKIAENLKPAWACLVPERREELTTEGGLNLQTRALEDVIKRLKAAGIRVSLFIEPSVEAVTISKNLGADAVELHTGNFARLYAQHGPVSESSKTHNGDPLSLEMARLKAASRQADQLGLLVNAGHGINYDNVDALVNLFDFNEFNIGFSIVANALRVGLETAVRKMKERMERKICVAS